MYEKNNRDGEKQYMKWNEHNEHCLFDFRFFLLQFYSVIATAAAVISTA